MYICRNLWSQHNSHHAVQLAPFASLYLNSCQFAALPLSVSHAHLRPYFKWPVQPALWRQRFAGKVMGKWRQMYVQGDSMRFYMLQLRYNTKQYTRHTVLYITSTKHAAATGRRIEPHHGF